MLLLPKSKERKKLPIGYGVRWVFCTLRILEKNQINQNIDQRIQKINPTTVGVQILIMARRPARICVIPAGYRTFGSYGPTIILLTAIGIDIHTVGRQDGYLYIDGFGTY